MNPIALYIVPTITAITAIILLVAGGKLLKPAIGLAAGLLGAGAGLMLLPIPDSVPPLVWALIFGIISALIAIYIAKFAILLLLSLSFACALPVATWHIAGLGDGTQVVENVVEAVKTPQESEAEPTGTTPIGISQDAMSVAFSLLAKDASQAFTSIKRRALSGWNAVPTGPRMMLVGSVVAGLLLGLLVATFMPFFASALVTSVGGSILLVEAVRNFITLFWSQQTMASISSTVLLFTIIGLALAGLGLQISLAKKTPKATDE